MRIPSSMPAGIFTSSVFCFFTLPWPWQVVHGSGIVATETEEREINVGDVVHVKAGENHWHGAKADTVMGHITVTLRGSKAVFA